MSFNTKIPDIYQQVIKHYHNKSIKNQEPVDLKNLCREFKIDIIEPTKKRFVCNKSIFKKAPAVSNYNFEILLKEPINTLKSRSDIALFLAHYILYYYKGTVFYEYLNTKGLNSHDVNNLAAEKGCLEYLPFTLDIQIPTEYLKLKKSKKELKKILLVSELDLHYKERYSNLKFKDQKILLALKVILYSLGFSLIWFASILFLKLT